MRDVVNGLVVASVATFSLGLILVMAGLAPRVNKQSVHMPLMLDPQNSDTATMPERSDSVSSRLDRGTHLPARRSVLHATTSPTRPAASPPADSARQECGGPDHEFTRCAYIRDSASVAHGYLVPRPSTGKVY